MSLAQALVGARVLEAAENYARADMSVVGRGESHEGTAQYVFEDEDFWRTILRDGAAAFNRQWFFGEAVICDWVARVPGLFWEPGSRALRDARPVLSEKVGRWMAYAPTGKSTKVMGGIGTLRMPPAPDGSRLVTVTTSLNASAGIPLLVPPDFPHVGYVVYGLGATWRPMAMTWSERFPSTRGIPRGYLALEYMTHSSLEHGRERPPVLIHPCAIMEYDNRGSRFFDFVFATADTAEPNWRGDIADFFEQYKNDRSRFGEYLTAGDHIEPLWDSRFQSPEALRSVDQHADAQLTLLGTRVREAMLGQSVTEDLVRLLAQHSLDDLKRFGTQSQTPPSLWFHGGTSADEAVQLVTAARHRKTFELLVESLAREHPAAFQPGAAP